MKSKFLPVVIYAVFTTFAINSNAQNAEAAAKKINYDFSGVDKSKSDKDLYGLRYRDFVLPLVKAVQELSKQNDSSKKGYDEKFTAQQDEIDELKAMIVNKQSKVVSSTSLLQNVPNPFSTSTIINYSLPLYYSSAKIIITAKNGSVLKEINLSQIKGSVNINASTFGNGADQYSLIIDGKMIASKQTEVIK